MKDIGWAVKQMRNGSCVARAGWEQRGMYLLLRASTEYSEIPTLCIYIRTAQGERAPWMVRQDDILATDWDVVGDLPFSPL